MPDWERYDGLNTRLGAPVRDRSTADRYHAQEDAHAWAASR